MAKKLRDREMARGMSQALYRYLPNRWIDFYITSTRDNYSAKVTNWSTQPLLKANTDRILRSVWNILGSYFESEYIGFNGLNNLDSWVVKTPVTSENSSSIHSEVNPLTFMCNNESCRRIFKFYNSEAFLKNENNKKCKACGHQLSQIRLLFYCDCGWADGVTAKPCPVHGYDSLRRKNNFEFSCTKCGRTIEMRKECPDCGKLLFPKNVLDSAHYYPHSMNVIDLIDDTKEKFIMESDEGAYAVIAFWLGYVSREQLNNAVKNGISIRDDNAHERLIQENMKKFRVTLGDGVTDELLRQLANQAVETNDSPTAKMHNAINKVRNGIANNDIDYMRKLAICILEYDTVAYPKEKSTLENACEMSEMLNTHPNPKEYYSIAENLGFEFVQACGKVPFITATYGYSRKDNTIGNGVKLHAFPEEVRGITNIYAIRMETEGVLFKFQPAIILKWLVDNHIINSSDLPDINNETACKIWFMDRLDTNQVGIFSPIESEVYPELSSVYTLLHTISHALIRQIAEFCGLDKNSMSEYIFCNIPAVFIYCQNSQGFSLGAMFNTFESHFADWMNGMLNEIDTCIFDPVCIDENGACLGCAFLNEISCCHFNKDLDRRYLIGWKEKVSDKRIIGFWEDI